MATVCTPATGKVFVYRNPETLENTPLRRDGECVALLQDLFCGIGKVSTWKPGKRVIDCLDSEIAVGTAIATFVDGKWPMLSHGNHACLYGGHPSRNVQTHSMMAFDIVEQFNNMSLNHIQRRRVHIKGMGPNGRLLDLSNNAAAFYIVVR